MGSGESKEDEKRREQQDQARKQEEARAEQAQREAENKERERLALAERLRLQKEKEEFEKRQKEEREELERQRKEQERLRKEEEDRRKAELERKRKEEEDANVAIQANITSLLANISGVSVVVAEASAEADKLLPITEEIRELMSGKKLAATQTLVQMDLLTSERQELQDLVGSILRQTTNLKHQNEISKNVVIQILGKDNEGGAIAWWELMTAVGWVEHSIESKYESFLRLARVVNDLRPEDILTLIAQRNSSARALAAHSVSLAGNGADHDVLELGLQFIQTQARSLVDAILDSNDGIYPALIAMHKIIMDETVVDPSRRSILLAWADRVTERNSSLTAEERFDATLRYLHALQALQVKGLILYVSALRAIGEDATAVRFAQQQKERMVQQKLYLVRLLVVPSAGAAAPAMRRANSAPPTTAAPMSVAQAKMLRNAFMGQSYGSGRSFGPGPAMARSGGDALLLDVLAQQLVNVFA